MGDTKVRRAAVKNRGLIVEPAQEIEDIAFPADNRLFARSVVALARDKATSPPSINICVLFSPIFPSIRVWNIFDTVEICG